MANHEGEVSSECGVEEACTVDWLQVIKEIR